MSRQTTFGDVGGETNPFATYESSVLALTGGQSQLIALSTASAPSNVINGASAVVYSDVLCFFRQGGAPIAVSNGTDQVIPAGVWTRITGIIPGNKLAFIVATGTGNLYLTPGA